MILGVTIYKNDVMGRRIVTLPTALSIIMSYNGKVLDIELKILLPRIKETRVYGVERAILVP